MGFFSKITRAITKPIKKVIKSPLGKAALLGLGAYYGPAMMGKTGWMGGANPLFAGGGKGAGMGKLGSYLFGTGSTQLGPQVTAGTPGLLSGIGSFIGKNKVPLAIAGGLGLGTAAMAKGAEEEEPSWAGDTGTGHADYLRARKLWDWGDQEPMFSANQGGRVGAYQGMYAGQGLGSLQGGQANMSEVDQPGDSNLSQIEDQGVLEDTTTDQGQSEDSELIMLIQQLAAMGIPLEQLRGRTKEELVEMMVYLSSQAQRETGEVEEVVTAAQGGRIGLDLGGPLERNPGANEIFLDQSTEVLRGGQDGDSIVEETENIERASYDPETDNPILDMEEWVERWQAHPQRDQFKDWQSFKRWSLGNEDQSFAGGGLMRTGYSLGTEHPVMPSKDGMQLDMRDTGGYQPLGKQEKKDDVRALLAQGEFVMTSDAVRGLGGGNREVGAKKMYDMMHNLEAMA